jgi:hypothetical protein
METKKRKFEESFEQSEETIKRQKIEPITESETNQTSQADVVEQLKNLRSELENLINYQQPTVKKAIFESDEYKLQLEQFNHSKVENPKVFPQEFRSLFSKIIQDSQSPKEKLIEDLHLFFLKKFDKQAIQTALDLYSTEENYGIKDSNPILFWESVHVKDISNGARQILMDYRKQRKNQRKKMNEILRNIKKLEKEEEKIQKENEKNKKKLEKEDEKKKLETKKQEKEEEKNKKKVETKKPEKEVKKPETKQKKSGSNGQSLLKFFSVKKEEAPKEIEPMVTVNQDEVNDRIDEALNKNYEIVELLQQLKSMKSQKTEKKHRVKIYQFSPKCFYLGEKPTKSELVKCRKPFTKDPLIDYEFDSEEEFEEEGENLTDEEDEEDIAEDDASELFEEGFLVEGDEDDQKENKAPINPTVFIGPYEDEKFEKYKIKKNFEFGEKFVKEEWKTLIGDKELMNLIDLLNCNSKKKTIEIFQTENPKIPKLKIEKQIHEIARREKRDDKMKWFVFEKVLEWRNKNENQNIINKV